MQRMGKTGRSNPPLLNAVLIPSMASAGAAIGTVVAEGVVFAVQFWALRKEVLSAYQKVRYGTIVLALALAIFSSKRASCLADGREGTADAIQKKKNWVVSPLAPVF